MIVTLFLIATITFFLMKLLPGSPYANEENLTDAQLQEAKATPITDGLVDEHEQISTDDNRLIFDSFLTMVADEVKEKTGVNDLEFKSIGSATIDGNNAIVPIIFSSKDLNQDITFNLLMKKLEDGTWQAIKVNNFKEYLELVDKDEKNKTNKLNNKTLIYLYS